MKSYNFIYRFTDIPSLLYMLNKKSITFLDPKKWPDKNDVHSISRFEELTEYEDLFALCFLKTSETSHHWSVYSPGNSGCYIEFDKNKLIEELTLNCKKFNFMQDEVTYVELNKFNEHQITPNKLPFIKRYPYRGEEEFRIVLGSKTSVRQSYVDIPIDHKCIKKVCLSPSLPPNIFKEIKKIIEGYCSEINVKKTTIYDNGHWKKLIDRIV